MVQGDLSSIDPETLCFWAKYWELSRFLWSRETDWDRLVEEGICSRERIATSAGCHNGNPMSVGGFNVWGDKCQYMQSFEWLESARMRLRRTVGVKSCDKLRLRLLSSFLVKFRSYCGTQSVNYPTQLKHGKLKGNQGKSRTAKTWDQQNLDEFLP